MKTVQVGGGAAAVIMLGVIAWAMSQSPIADDFSIIADRPWGIVSLVDLYVGLAVAAGWIAYREASTRVGVVWILALAILGNLALGVYLLVTARQAVRHGGVAWFFMGSHAETSS